MSVFFFKQKTAYEVRISDWSSDVCSSDLFELALRIILESEYIGRQLANWGKDGEAPAHKRHADTGGRHSERGEGRQRRCLALLAGSVDGRSGPPARTCVV